MKTMKAIRFHQYGSVDALKLEEITVPTPGDEQVLVRVSATSINLIEH